MGKLNAAACDMFHVQFSTVQYLDGCVCAFLRDHCFCSLWAGLVGFDDLLMD
jgi:hypothetical protein